MVRGIAYNDTLDAAYTAYIKPGTQGGQWAFMPSEFSGAFKLMQTHGRPGSGVTQGHNMEVPFVTRTLDEHLEGHLARKEKVYSRMRQ